MNNEIVGRLLQVPREHLVVCIRRKLYDIADADIDDAQKTLILLLELLLIEDLNCKDCVLIHRSSIVTS